jgi:hypothetical protein
MRRSFAGMGCLLAALLPGPAQAGVHADTLGRCAIGATSAAERTALLRWIFITAAANPELADLASVDSAVRERSVRAAANVFNRVLLTACRRESVAALRHEGAGGLQRGFEALGQLAGMEMMTSPAGMAAMAQLGSYMDTAGLAALGREAGERPPT